MKASQTETVIMLTCCALQSACYSPTGIVISFILAQFQGEVQTNLTEGHSFLLFRVCLRGFGGGGSIGGFVLVWRLLVAAWYVPLTIYRLIVGY